MSSEKSSLSEEAAEEDSEANNDHGNDALEEDGDGACEDRENGCNSGDDDHGGLSDANSDITTPPGGSNAEECGGEVIKIIVMKKNPHRLFRAPCLNEKDVGIGFGYCHILLIILPEAQDIF